MARTVAPRQDAEPPPFDPADHTVTEVLEHVDANPDQLETVTAAELAGKARVTLIDALQARGA